MRQTSVIILSSFKCPPQESKQRQIWSPSTKVEAEMYHKHTDISLNKLTHTHWNTHTHPHLHRNCLSNLLTNRNRRGRFLCRTHTRIRINCYHHNIPSPLIKITVLKISPHTHTCVPVHTRTWKVFRHGCGSAGLLSSAIQNRPLLTVSDRERKTIRKSPPDTHMHTLLIRHFGGKWHNSLINYVK